MTSTQFFGSQIGGQSVINYGYTDMPWKLFAYDVYYFFSYLWALPYILWPVKPSSDLNSGHLDELSPTPQNLFCIAVHFVLVIFQLAFFLVLPFSILFPIPVVIAAVGAYLLFNYGLCMLINGTETEYHSDPEYAPALPEHAHEQWIFINGVAVGQHWMKSNLNRLALTFKRPILGIHNKTNGILFDVVECLVQRNLGYATADVRVCYRIIKAKLYNPAYSKVVFVLHSQGGIEGGLILDWLLQELPQDLLAKLEVYTFGNAANHFNNPHRHLGSQTRAAALTNTTALAADVAVVNGLLPTTNGDLANNPSSSSSREGEDSPSNTSYLRRETSARAPSAVSDRAIGHIEHYAHTTDFVALWGVLHFATSRPGSPTVPRFIGRLLARSAPGGGHQFCQHYLDGMFPLAWDAEGRRPVGCLDEDETGGGKEGEGRGRGRNEFMESEVVVGDEGDREEMAREAMEASWVGGRRGGTAAPVPVEVHGGSRRNTGVTMKVKDLSRLWLYRNGRSPSDTPPLLARDADGVVRNATM